MNYNGCQSPDKDECSYILLLEMEIIFMGPLSMCAAKQLVSNFEKSTHEKPYTKISLRYLTISGNNNLLRPPGEIPGGKGVRDRATDNHMVSLQINARIRCEGPGLKEAIDKQLNELYRIGANFSICRNVYRTA